MNEELITRIVQSVIAEVMPDYSLKEERFQTSDSCILQANLQYAGGVKMTLQLAVALIEKVEEKAQSMNVPVVVAVSDAAGRPVAIHCMDDAYMGSFDVALNKTFTSAGFKMSTEQLGQLSQPGKSLYGIQFTNGGKVVIFGGGEPLMADGTMIGAIGVSGGNAKQDTQLAAYGSSILREVIKCL